MRLLRSRLLLILIALVVTAQALAAGSGSARAASYTNWVAQDPANPTSADVVHVWVSSDTAYGETILVEYQIGGVYTQSACSYDTSYTGADWRCDIPAQAEGTSVSYQIITQNQYGSNYRYSGFNWSYTVAAAQYNIHWGGLFADQSPFFMSPVETSQGGNLTLRLRSLHGDLTSANVNWYDSGNPSNGWGNWIPMHVVGQDATGTYDFWEADASALLNTSATKYYRFQANQGSATTWINAFGPTCGNGSQTNCQAPDSSNFWVIPGFRVPSWTMSSIFYQIFPDRFRNGDPSNDIPFHSSTAVAPDSNGNCPTGSYNYGGNCAFTHNSWNELPTQPGTGIDFYGGDLQGITQEIDPYLKDTLGVNALYLNPIFESPSDHKYDTQDYYKVDPHFGTNTGSGPGSLTSLIGTAHSTSNSEPRMSVMLDGVFNHTGDWNCWFNRPNNDCGSDPGAFQSSSSQYRNWYKFLPGFDKTTAPNNYCSWSGFGSLPQLNYSNQAVRNAIYADPNSVMQTYVKPPYNIDGWRLDVADNYSDLDSASSSDPCGIGIDNHQIWQQIRPDVKTANPNALILGEFWQSPTAWLGGDQWDSVMNYNGFGVPVSRFLTNQNVHGEPDGGLKPSDLRNWLVGTLADNNRSSQLAMLNSLSTHDTSRFLYRACTAVQNGDSTGCGNQNNIPAAAYAKLKMAIEMQMTYVGMPSIYYGDEIGTTGGNDPDNRRTFDWNQADWNHSVLDLTSTLTHNRSAHEAWQDGSFMPLVVDDTNNVFAYGRVLLDPSTIGTGVKAKDAAVVALNNSSTQQTVTMDATQVGLIDGTQLTDLVSGNTVTVSGGKITITLDANTGAVLTPTPTQVPALALPGQPTNLHAQAANGQVTLQWNAPTTGGPVTSYDVTASPSGTVGIVSCDNGTPQTCTVTVTGVDTAGPSSYSVAASNATGDGPAATIGVAGSAIVSLSNLTATYDGNPHGVTVTTIPSGLDVSVVYTDSNNAVVASPTHAGTYGVVATITTPGYSGTASGQFVIGKADQHITFPAISDQQLGTADFAPGASSDSGLTIAYTATGNCSIVGGTEIHLTGTGSCTVTADQAGNGDYNAASSVQQTFSIYTVPAQVVLGNLTAVYDGNPHYATASTTPSGLSVAITYTDSNNNAVTNPIHAGSYGVSATVTSQGYNGSTSGTLVISKADQTVSFDPLADKTFGDPAFQVSASATSGLPVSFSATGDCSVSGTTVTITGAGGCTVTATQAGNDDWNSAQQSRSFNIGKATATLSFVSSSLNQTYDGTPKTVSVTTSPANLGGVSVTYDNSSSAPTHAGQYTVTATLTNANYAAQSVSDTLTVSPASQSITFGTLADRTYGDPDISLNASATSGLTVSYSAGANDACTVSGATVHITGVGNCTITATQGGNTDWQQASPVVQGFSIAAAPTNVGSVTVSTTSGNPTPQFSDAVTLKSTVSAASTSTGNGVFSGTVSFSVNGLAVGSSQPVSNGSPTAQVTVQLDAGVLPAGAGSYPVSATFTPLSGNYGTGTSAAQSLQVQSEGQRADGSADGSVRLDYSGDHMTRLGTSATLQATVLQSQAPEASDARYVEFGSATVQAVFSLYPAGCGSACSNTPSWTSSPVAVTNRADWASTGAGVASVTAPSTLDLGAYIVTVSLVPNSYVLSETATSALAVAPTSGAFTSGGGWLTSDSSSNAANPAGQFAFYGKRSGASIPGASAYVYRMRMDVSSGAACSSLSASCRDVDVIVRSARLTLLSAPPALHYPVKAYLAGQAAVQFVDALDGTVYTQLGFTGGMFRLDVTDKSAGGTTDQYGFTVYGKNGGVFHQAYIPPTHALPQRSVVLRTNQDTIGGGNVIG